MNKDKINQYKESEDNIQKCYNENTDPTANWIDKTEWDLRSGKITMEELLAIKCRNANYVPKTTDNAMEHLNTIPRPNIHTIFANDEWNAALEEKIKELGIPDNVDKSKLKDLIIQQNKMPWVNKQPSTELTNYPTMYPETFNPSNNLTLNDPMYHPETTAKAMAYINNMPKEMKDNPLKWAARYPLTPDECFKSTDTKKTTDEK